jgi:hypothetical protein
MTKNTPKSHLGVKGAMTKKGADRAGNKLSNAALILASGIAAAIVIWAVRWW